MKRALLAATILMATACGQKSDDSSAKGFPGFQVRPAALTDASLTFERDLRPVDGAKTTVTIVREENGSYDLSKSTQFFDRLTGKEVQNNESLGSGMACTRKLNEIDCSRDLRPVDGALVTVSFLNNAGEYDVALESRFFDRQSGEEKVERKDIASGLSLQAAAAAPAAE